MSHEAITLWTEASSDPELIAGVRAGDGTAFGVLYQRHVDAARKVAAQYTNAASDVDDVVAESFSRVLRVLQRGDGPDLAFRAYLFTIVRRTGMEYINRGNRTRPGDDMTQYESVLGYEAPSDEGALEGFEQGVVAEAFKSLPERWQAVLWYTEVEKKSPKEIAPLLGLTANGVAALAYRAREALRQAYLQQHLNVADSMDCLAASTQLGAYVRGGLAKREHGKVDDHVQSCEKCSALVAELEDVNRGMRGIIAPLVLGVLGMGALEGGLPIGGFFAGTAAAGASGSSTGAAGGAAGGGTAAGVGAGGAGLAAWVGSASAFALPAAAAIGIVALVVSGASYLGVFNPLGRAEGLTPASSPTPEPSPTSGDGSTTSPTAAPTPEPSVSPTVDPTVSPSVDPTAGPGDPDFNTSGGSTDPRGGGSDPDPTTDPTTDPSPDPTTDPSPDPTTEPSPDPTTDPSPDPSPEPTPTDDPTPPKVASLAFGSVPLEFLEIATSTPVVGITLANSGDGDAEDVTASITLPDGLTFAAPPGGASSFSVTPAAKLTNFLTFAAESTFVSGDWDCTLLDSRATATCTLDVLEAGAESTLTLTLAPITDATVVRADAWTMFTASSGDVKTSYRVRTALEPQVKDLKGTFAGTGHYAATQVGTTVLGCDLSKAACQKVMAFAGTGVRGDTIAGANNNDQAMIALNRAGGTANSGSTTLSEQLLPAGATVKYALLEWSANKYSTDKWSGALNTARFKVPGGEYASITADSSSTVHDDDRDYYQARADVTELVAAAGNGTYSLADIALAAKPRSNNYGGFTLTVVYELESLPVSRVAVFAGSQWVDNNRLATFTFYADTATEATIGWTAWEGDRGTDGDALRIDDKAVTPWGWNGSAPVTHASSNAADSSAFGSEFANTLGVDAKSFGSATLEPGLHTLKANTSGDVYIVGSLTVTLTAGD